MNQTNEERKIKEQKLIEESDIKLSEDLFSKTQKPIDKSSNVNVVKIGKNKFVSVIKPIVIEEKNINIISEIPTPQKKTNKCYDLNDFNYDDDFDFIGV